MQERQESRMNSDINQLIQPLEATIITKHHCFTFISFLLGELREEIKEVLKEEGKFEESKRELQILRLNRVLGHCPFPELCDQYDVCDKEECNADECNNGNAFRRS